MSRYNKAFARAWAIVAKHQNLDVSDAASTNTELSILASSQFNSMEGIESSHGINIVSSNVGVGGIGASLAVQDAQDNPNAQGAQGNQGNDSGSSVGSGIMPLSTGISPRRTRSGKIVKYRED